MSKFFDSAMVKSSLVELAELQERLIQQILYIPYMNVEQKRKHLELLKEYLEKQKILFFRISLSDDNEAKKIKESVIKNAKMFGIIDSEDPQVFYSTLEKTIVGLEKMIEVE